MKLITMTNMSLDGVMQGLGDPDEDRRGGFTRGGWAEPLFDEEAATALGQIYRIWAWCSTPVRWGCRAGFS